VSGGYLAFACLVRRRCVVSATGIAFSYSLLGKMCGSLIFQEGMSHLLELVLVSEEENWFVRGCLILVGPCVLLIVNLPS